MFLAIFIKLHTNIYKFNYQIAMHGFINSIYKNKY